MEMPKWIRSRLSKEDFDQVERAIIEAEKMTSGEIVPIIVHRSSTIGHVPVILASLLFLLVVFFDIPGWQSEHFGVSWLWWGLDILICYLLAWFLLPIEFFERLLTPKEDQEAQVDHRARLEFYESNIQKTAGKTGILLFISLMEHRAVVLADKAIADKLPSDTWQGVVNSMIQGIKKDKVATGLCEGIRQSGELLSKHFPIEQGDVDELPNHLVIKE